MKKRKIIISIIVIAVSITSLRLLFPAPISERRIKNEFELQKANIVKVAEYFENQEYASVYIASTDQEGIMFASKNDQEIGKQIIISDEEISTVITGLFKKNIV